MIREAKITDFESIEKLLGQNLVHHHTVRPDIFKDQGSKFTVEELHSILADENQFIDVFESEEGDVVAYIFLQLKFSKHHMVEHKSLFIEDLCVDKTYRGQKVGLQLMEHAEKVAKSKGCYNVTLNVWSDNKRAVSFYERNGFKTREVTLEKKL